MARSIGIYRNGWEECWKLGAQLWLRGLLSQERFRVEVLQERFESASEALALGEVDGETIFASMAISPERRLS